MKQFLLFLFISISFINSYAQDINVGPQVAVLVDCNNLGHLYDSGGGAGDYAAGESFVLTICPSGTTPVALEFLSATFGHPNDFLAIYNGAATVNSADLLYSFSQTSAPNLNTIFRTTTANASGCITIQFVSDATSTGGSFDFNILCLLPCKLISAAIPTANLPVVPNDTVYINSCLTDAITFTGAGIYDPNTALYIQSDATSNFYWDFSGAGLDTGQVVTKSFNPGIYAVKLIVEDVFGCQSLNEINLKIRQALVPDVRFTPSDTTLCIGEEFVLIPYLITTSNEILIIGDTAVFDTLKIQTKVAIQDTSYLPDDSDGISGNDITTPAIFDFPIYGYQPGATLQNINDLYYVCIDIEHSYVGDLDIVIECPNGQSVALVDFSPPLQANGWDLGEPIFGTTPGQQGVPYTYCWSPSANPADVIGYNNATVQANLINGNTVDTSINYSPPNNDWANLLGCPLNGTWAIQVFDDFGGDDGYVFGAAIEFDGSFALEPDTFIVAYTNPFWDTSNQILSNLNDDTITVKALNNPFQTQTFHFEDNLGCTWETDFNTVTISSFDVLNQFQDTTMCNADTLNIFATIQNEIPTSTYTYTWTPSSEILNTSLNQATIYPTTNTEYYVEVINAFGCKNYDTSYVYIDDTQKPVLDLTTIANQFCCEGTELNVQLADFVSAQPLNTSYWNGAILVGDSFSLNSDDFVADTMNVIIKIVADNGCEQEKSISFYRYCLNPSIEVHDSIWAGDSKIFDLTLTEYDNMTYGWATSDVTEGAITDVTVQDAEFNGVNEGVYEASVTAIATFNQPDGSVLECVEGSETKSYEVVDILELQYFDAFTPNSGDELNNYFRPILSEFAEILDFRIYNRWGTLVYNYETDESKKGWDGTVDGVDQEAGTYTYFMRIKHFSDEFTKEDVVNLLR